MFLVWPFLTYLHILSHLTSLSFFPPHGVFTKNVPHKKCYVFDTLMSRFSNFYKKLQSKYCTLKKVTKTRFPQKIANDETFGEIKSCYLPQELSIYIKIRTKSEYQFPTPTVRKSYGESKLYYEELVDLRRMSFRLTFSKHGTILVLICKF